MLTLSLPKQPFVTSLLIVASICASAATPPLASAQATEESYQLRLFEVLQQYEGQKEPIITIENIQAYESVSTLETLQGQSQQRQSPLWLFILSADGNVLERIESQTDQQGSFSISTTPLGADHSGQLQLVISHLPDLQLALAVPEKTRLLPITLYQNEELQPEQQRTPFALSIDSIQFSEGEQVLETLHSDILHVYRHNPNTALDVHITGKLFGENIEQAQLFSTLLPTLQQDHHLSDPEQPEELSISISAADLPTDETIKLILQGQEVAFPDDYQQAQTSLSFILHPADEMPHVAGIIWNNTAADRLSLLLFTMLIASFVFFVIFHIRSRSFLKIMTIILMISELGLLGYHSSTNTIKELFEAGLLTVPGQELIIQRQQAQQQPALTLTKLNENLEVVPALSTSWSNISPTIWEFTLRRRSDEQELQNPIERVRSGLANLLDEETTPSSDPITAPTVIRALKTFLDQQEGQQQFLASVKQIVGINSNRIQFITRFPDPLLPQKLSKVALHINQQESELAENSQLYITLESFSDHKRERRNDDYFDLPFMDQTPIYRSEIYTSNLDQLKHQIAQSSADILDDPEPILWPNLFQADYSIVPRINTQSVFLYLNRNSPFVSDPKLVQALKAIVQTPSVLQTSYYQYGQLAQQFAPPGVVGYDPKLNPKYGQDPSGTAVPLEDLPEEEIILPETLLEQAKAELGVSSLTLTLNYPHEESRLAGVIESELQRYGINVIPRAISEHIDDDDLAQDLPDLILLTLDFDLGDVGPFLDTLIDSESAINSYYHNPEVDQLIKQSRSELNRFNRLELIQRIMAIIVDEDPAGIPLLFKRSFTAKKNPIELSWWEKLLQQIVLHK